MDTSTTTFCRFSPLRTPGMQRKGTKKYNSPRKDVSDTESLASVLTSEIRSIAHSVSDRLKGSSDIGMSSDDDLFISQSKKVASPAKSVKKRTVSNNHSDSTSLDSSSESEPDTVKPSISRTQKMKSPKKRIKVDSEDPSPSKRLKSPIKSTSKSRRKQNDHEISEGSEDSKSSEPDTPKSRKSSASSVLTSSTDSPKRRKSNASSVLTSSTDCSKGRKSSASSVLTSSTDSSKGRRGSASSMASSNSSEGRKEKGDSDSADSDKSGSDSDSSNKSSEKGKKLENQRSKLGVQNVLSEDSDFETSWSKAKKNHNENKTTVSKESSFNKSGSKKLRYKIPESFEIDTSAKYLSKSEIQGKQLWLITAPDDFDISILHRQKIDLTGSSIITSEETESEQQFEVVARPVTSQMSSYSSVASQASGSEEFGLGPEISGQLQVMGWIPCMPPVELAISPPKKHRVPDHLKPTFVPFGSVSPRQNDEEFSDIQKAEKHKKKKKKKDKKKK